MGFCSAIMAGLRVIDGMKVFGLDAGIGITSGRVWCGVCLACEFSGRFCQDIHWLTEPHREHTCLYWRVGVVLQTVGNDLRKEYTALGDFVNLAARLMAKAGPREIYVDA